MESRRGLEILGGGVIGGPLRMPGDGAVPAAVPPTTSRAVPFPVSGCHPDIGTGGTRRQERVPNYDAIPDAVPDAFYDLGRPDTRPALPTGIRAPSADDPVHVHRSTGPSTDRVAADAPGGRTGPVPEGAIADRCR